MSEKCRADDWLAHLGQGCVLPVEKDGYCHDHRPDLAPERELKLRERLEYWKEVSRALGKGDV